MLVMIKDDDLSEIPSLSVFAGKSGQSFVSRKVENVVVFYFDVVDDGHFPKVFSNVLYNYPALRAPVVGFAFFSSSLGKEKASFSYALVPSSHLMKKGNSSRPPG